MIVITFLGFLQLSSNMFAIVFSGDKIKTGKIVIINTMNLKCLKMFKISKDLKFFLIALIAFIASHFIYNNFVTISTANNISFRDITVEVFGEVELKISCNGNNVQNPPKVNRGIGQKTDNECIGTGKFKAKLPQQRFIEE